MFNHLHGFSDNAASEDYSPPTAKLIGDNGDRLIDNRWIATTPHLRTMTLGYLTDTATGEVREFEFSRDGVPTAREVEDALIAFNIALIKETGHIWRFAEQTEILDFISVNRAQDFMDTLHAVADEIAS